MTSRPGTALILTAALLCLGAGPRKEASVLARKAKEAAKKGEDTQAYLLYSEAAALQPGNKRYRAMMLSLQNRAALQAKSAPAPQASAFPAGEEDRTPDPLLDPEQIFTSLTAREFARARQPQEPPRLAAEAGRQDFDLRAEPKALFEQVAKSFGLEVVFDGEYPPANSPMKFQMKDVDYRDALRGLEAATSSFVVPISPKLIMVAKDNLQKRGELEQTVTLTVPVPQVLTPQELTEIVAGVRQVTGAEKVAWDSSRNQVVIRDRISRAVPAQLLLDELVHYRAEVAIDVEFLQVSDSDIRNYGFNVTNTFTLSDVGHVFGQVASSSTALTNILTFGGGRTLFGLGVAQVQAMFNQTNSNAKTLLQATVRSADGQPATFHVGEKYPVITSSFGGGTTSTTGTTSYAAAPSYTFQDLGITLKITPHVHTEGDVSLAVESTYAVLAGSSINGVPVIGNRNSVNQVRLKSDEWAVIAGMITESKQKSVSGFWGLARLPLIGNLFKQVSKDDEKQNILIAVKPRLVGLPPGQFVGRTMHVGTEVRPFSPL